MPPHSYWSSIGSIESIGDIGSIGRFRINRLQTPGTRAGCGQFESRVANSKKEMGQIFHGAAWKASTDKYAYSLQMWNFKWKHLEKVHTHATCALSICILLPVTVCENEKMGPAKVSYYLLRIEWFRMARISSCGLVFNAITRIILNAGWFPLWALRRRSLLFIFFRFVHRLHFGSLWSLATENLHISILGDVWSHNDRQIYVPECVRNMLFFFFFFFFIVPKITRRLKYRRRKTI